MRARACAVVLAVMFSPLASAMCELKCSPSAAAVRLAAPPPCHEAGHEPRDASRLQPHHCGSVHPDAIATSTAPGAMYQAVAILGTVVGLIDQARPSFDVFVGRPPGGGFHLPSVSSPPLRI
jgi:hypothetical protein